MTACYLAFEVTDDRRSCFSAAHLNGIDRQYWLPYRLERGVWLRCENRYGGTTMPTCFPSVDDARAYRDRLGETFSRPIVIVHATNGEILDAPVHTESVR